MHRIVDSDDLKVTYETWGIQLSLGGIYLELL